MKKKGKGRGRGRGYPNNIGTRLMTTNHLQVKMQRFPPERINVPQHGNPSTSTTRDSSNSTSTPLLTNNNPSLYSKRNYPPVMPMGIKPIVDPIQRKNSPQTLLKPPNARKDYHLAQVTKIKPNVPPNKLNSYPVNERTNLVSKATDFQFSKHQTNKFYEDPRTMTLREEQIPNEQVTGLLELALGQIVEEIMSNNSHNEIYKRFISYPINQQALKQMVRERIRTVMLNKTAGSVGDVVSQYRESFSKESDKHIIESVVNSEKNDATLKTGRQSPGRQLMPPRRMSPKRHSLGRRSASPRPRSPLMDAQTGMRGYCEEEEAIEKVYTDTDNDFEEYNLEEEESEDLISDFEQDDNFNVREHPSSEWQPKEPDLEMENEDTTELNTNGGDQEAFTNSKDATLSKRLSGARRKRYKMLIAVNVPPEEALEICQKPWDQLPADAHPKNRARKARIALWESNALLHNNYNAEDVPYFYKGQKYAEVQIRNIIHMTEEQSYILRQTLISKIMQLPKSQGPRFLDYGYMHGTLMVSCMDKQSQMWLYDNVPLVAPWPGAKLIATFVSACHNPVVFKALLPESETCDVREAFTLIDKQNPGLNTEDWELLSWNEVRDGLHIIVAVDQLSAITLKETNFQVCVGFKTIRFYL